jgi:hypothetical protein
MRFRTIADNVPLVGELDAVEAFEEETHAIAFEPESEFELVAGDGFEVVGAVEVGGSVDVGCSGSFEVLEVCFFADVLGTFKHHVLEEMGEAGAAGALVERADVVPEVDGYEGQAMVFVSEDDEAVGQGEFFVLELGDLEGLGRGEIVGSTGDGGEGEAGEKSGELKAVEQAAGCIHVFFSREIARSCWVKLTLTKVLGDDTKGWT